MKKTILLTAMMLLSMAGLQQLQAQSTFTADLQLILRDTTTHYVLDDGDSVDIDVAVINHGPDDIDTSNFIIFGFTNLPPGWALVVQSDIGEPVPLPNGDTVNSSGIRFHHGGDFERDTTYNYCYYLMTNEDVDSFVYDPNQLNDTVCFSITYKKDITGIGKLSQAPPLRIAPNPATDLVRIPLNDFRQQVIQLSVYSIDGRKVYQESIKPGRQESQLDVHTWNKGMYIVELQSETKKQQGKFVVQ